MFSSSVISSARERLQQQRRDGADRLADAAATVWDIIIVGGGLTGASTLFHLIQSERPPSSILLLDHGSAGAGTHDRFATEPLLPKGVAEEDLHEEEVYHPGNSGGVIFSPPHFLNGPTCLKFIVRLYPSTTPNFIAHHGKSGARNYLRLAALGIEIEKSLCRQVIPDAIHRGVLEEEGSVLVADRDNYENMLEEFRLLKELGCDDIEWWSEKEVLAYHGSSSNFYCGIFFPKDARIDSLEFVASLITASQKASQTNVVVIENCPSLIDVVDSSQSLVTASFVSGVNINAKHAVIATNGLFLNRDLAGILIPCWSYFVALPHPVDPLAKSVANAAIDAPFHLRGNNSHNYFTYGFTHDWCVTKGVYRVSGSDHFSALKPPRAAHHARLLSEWTLEKYPYMAPFLPAANDLPSNLKGRFVYGVYGETPDSLPVVGKTGEHSRIIYAVGCNAWGQASMSFVASIIPGLLGCATLTEDQVKGARLLAMSRFKTQPVYLRRPNAKL